MSNFQNLDPFYLSLLGVALALPCLWAAHRISLFVSKPAGKSAHIDPPSAVLLYRNGFLIDANPAGLALLENTETDPETWTTLVNRLAPRFPDFPTTQGSDKGRHIRIFSPANPDDPASASLEQWEDFARVRLTETSPRSIAKEHAAVDTTAQRAPYPIWISAETGEITWANEAYMTLARNIAPEGEATQRLFEDAFLPDETKRTKLRLREGEDELWFDISTRQSGTSMLHYATDANALVHAEIAQRNFVQTLTKTFAQLSIGLAIFDRNRQLTLFNPALIDLTNLPADFLSSRPSLLTFFDRLRETRMIPEPKNYNSWRQQIAELVIAASDDRYCETWSLPSGVTYKIHGRPHPDGAIALLFEDISAEVSLTRRFRSQLDLVQAVLDSLDEAVVVFSPVGAATFSNSAYRRYWKSEVESDLSDYSTSNALEAWKTHFEPSDIWDRLELHLDDINPRPDLVGIVRTEGGKAKCIRAVYLHGGNKAVVFSDLLDTHPNDENEGYSPTTAYPACEEEVAV